MAKLGELSSFYYTFMSRERLEKKLGTSQADDASGFGLESLLM